MRQHICDNSSHLQSVELTPYSQFLLQITASPAMAAGCELIGSPSGGHRFNPVQSVVYKPFHYKQIHDLSSINTGKCWCWFRSGSVRYSVIQADIPDCTVFHRNTKASCTCLVHQKHTGWDSQKSASFRLSSFADAVLSPKE